MTFIEADHTELERPSPPTVPQTTALTPMAMLDRAIASGAGIEVLERLMSLQERWEKAQARKEFDAAISAAKSEIPVIHKNRSGHNTKYADFAAIANAVAPALAKHGLSYRFRTVQNGTISVTCILSHTAGHSEENTLSANADKSGAKNDIQAIGSALTYLQRYSLIQALGLAASEDDDGRAAGDASTITQEEADTLKDKMRLGGLNMNIFCSHYKINRVEDLPASRLEAATESIQNKVAEKAAKKDATK